MSRLFSATGLSGVTSPLKAVILYDTRESGFRAKELFDRLSVRSNGQLRYELELYRFDLLARQSKAAEALAEAGRADLVVVAMDHGKPLPRSARAWLETWASKEARGGQALVGLPDEEPGLCPTLSPAVAALRACAARHGLTFLCQWDLDAAVAWEHFATDLDLRAHAITPTLQRLMDRTRYDTYVPWGLNE